MTESFEKVCASYGDCTWIGRDGVKRAIDRLKAAHEAEIADLQGQYERKIIDLQKTHEHDIEQLRRLRFREGYEAGQRSMDSEHYAVALRLRQLPLDEDSHGNLSQIARAVWHSDFGWTKGACASLRDELVRLMGGVHEPVQGGEPDAPRCNRGDCDCGGSQTVTIYDELDNERHKAVCRLREIQTDAGGFVKALANALGVEWQAPRVVQTIAEVRDRLIHLLGGDEPTAMEYIQRIVREHDRRCLDIELIGARLAQLSSDAMSMRAESDKNGDICETEPRNTVESSKYRENYKSGYITDELRGCIDTCNKTYDDTPWHEMDTDPIEHTICHVTEGELIRIADRIDEQFERILQQHEATLQSTVENMATTDELVKQRDRARAEVVNLRTAYYMMQRSLEQERDELRDELDEYDKTHMKTHMKLPVDANGESVHIGDIMEYAEGGKPKEVIAVSDTEVFLVDDGPRYSSLCVHHAPVDTAESIVRDLTLGTITEREAVRRIQRIADGTAEALDGRR